ncbi:relaxase/mobilization nuclease domain-containing protein [Moraxella haemolytica]|uniref:relaxase/mobilization nuclease domain-containing protein n=1 Tax=Moraxella haemolytica TaxID=2904119 RepID=UPI002542A9DA|nr:relaxase/mobilization nuclease domain-containing protein [Moraxella sp. ZY171148]WII95207.1 relaxase/mobilization nuclease domain-containing protein [Moraxella sp. ZY171148]
MIVKFFSRGRGNCSATMNYLLGKDKDREHAKVLQGNPELTERLADNLEFKNRYTVGVLSFQESDLDDNAKREIMASFEKSLLAGLDQDQYDITWIEHKDKDRLELNFVIPNVELTTGKRLQPYYDRADRPLVENWKQVINHDYGLSDPNDPRKAQAIKIDPHRLPESVQAIKETIGIITSKLRKGL